MVGGGREEGHEVRVRRRRRRVGREKVGCSLEEGRRRGSGKDGDLQKRLITDE